MKRKSILITPAVALALLTCFTGCMSKEAKSAQKKIDALPDNYSEDILSDLEKASEAYEALENEDKEQVDDDLIDDLYEQYYKSISDEANQKIEDFDPTKYSTIENYSKGLEDFNQIVDFIKKADINAYPDIDFNTLRNKLSTYKGYLIDFVNETKSLDTSLNTVRTNLQTISDNYSNYSMVATFCGNITFGMESVSSDYVNKDDFLAKIEELKSFASSNTYSDSNSMEFVNKYTAAADAYNTMIEEVNSYYEKMDLESFEEQTDELIQNVEELNDVIDNANESFNE
ncbi:hypothetical protein [Porcipelethomonas sp.]|uniref:hypothetical protein n=1 Tax=Porcipelethomonas sp. TaxID=2981675 RepID=UPI003EF6899A